MESQKIELEKQGREITRCSADINFNMQSWNTQELFKRICEMEERCRKVILILDDEHHNNNL